MSPVTVPRAGLAVVGLGNKPFSGICFPQDLNLSDWAERESKASMEAVSSFYGNPSGGPEQGREGREHRRLSKVKMWGGSPHKP